MTTDRVLTALICIARFFVYSFFPTPTHPPASPERAASEVTRGAEIVIIVAWRVNYVIKRL